MCVGCVKQTWLEGLATSGDTQNGELGYPGTYADQ